MVITPNSQFGEIEAIKRAQDQVREAETREMIDQSDIRIETRERQNYERRHSFEDLSINI